jgi:phosphoglycerol geranylgeranyltransferase
VSGLVWGRLLDSVRRRGTAHIVLVDPDRATPERARALARECADADVDALLFGSSTPFERDPSPILQSLRAGAPDLPVIQFPGSAAQLTPHVDAALFLSLLSGRDPRFLIEEQAKGAPLLLEWGVEAIPVGYLLVDSTGGGSVERVTGTAPLPAHPADLVVRHAQAAACLGMAAVYLEAGSGAKSPVPAALVRAVSRAVPIPVIVGGGVRDPGVAALLAAAGARLLVTGSIHEAGQPVRPFTNAVHSAAALV